MIFSLLKQGSTYPGCPEYLSGLEPLGFIFIAGLFFILFTIIHYIRKIWRN